MARKEEMVHQKKNRLKPQELEENIVRILQGYIDREYEGTVRYVYLDIRDISILLAISHHHDGGWHKIMASNREIRICLTSLARRRKRITASRRRVSCIIERMREGNRVYLQLKKL